MEIPPLAPIPPSNVRLGLQHDEWEACLDAWLTLAKLHLQLRPEEFSKSSSADLSLVSFLVSYYLETANLSREDLSLRGTAKARDLLRTCLKLCDRFFLHADRIESLIQWEFLGNFCHVHRKNAALPVLMKGLWKRQTTVLEKIVAKQKISMTENLETGKPANSDGQLRRLASIMHASPDAALMFMAGSDFLDAIVAAYERTTSDEERKAAVSVIYLGLLSTMKAEQGNSSLLTDTLYSLKSYADRASTSPSPLHDLVTNTPLVAALRRLQGQGSTERLKKLLLSLETYKRPDLARRPGQPRRRFDKGKGKAVHGSEERQIHLMSLVTQVQDLFPDLGSGFVLKLLDEYKHDVEQVTAHLLDGSLPPDLRDSDHTEPASVNERNEQPRATDLAPRASGLPPEPFVPARRNVFDNDDFDRLEMDASRLHIGKKDKSPPDDSNPNKAAILSALASFDSDDDERDDTYDVDDVGGTIDTAHPDGEPGPAARVTQQENHAALFAAYKTNPELFGRTFDIRRGQARAALKAETGMTDEAIEGWAIMLQRDPKRAKRLEADLGAFDGSQSALPSTAYRGAETDDSDAPADRQHGDHPRGRGRGTGRGRGRGGPGRGGGNVAGPSTDAGTAAAQRRKEANKSSRANHNRRDQRAKKIARGGFPG